MVLPEGGQRDVLEDPRLDNCVRCHLPNSLGGELWEVYWVAFVVWDLLQYGPVCKFRLSRDALLATD